MIRVFYWLEVGGTTPLTDSLLREIPDGALDGIVGAPMVARAAIALVRDPEDTKLTSKQLMRVAPRTMASAEYKDALFAAVHSA
ncbi:hypothetical protein H9P43_007142 [Blastocladiella emersonii ATCC 22665]|nr:hypothetical protein H9P43_007142 [Blastocladiella emersonii ATCC 22665]